MVLLALLTGVVHADCSTVNRAAVQLMAHGSEAQITRARAMMAECGTYTSLSSLYHPRNITSRFGPRRHPVHGRTRHHAGVDLRGAHGDPIRALAGGWVKRARFDRGYGWFVEVEHPLSGLTTVYAHASKLRVRKGDIVQSGQIIAHVGSTGLSTGPHLHLEVRLRGVPVDPVPYLRSPSRLR